MRRLITACVLLVNTSVAATAPLVVTPSAAEEPKADEARTATVFERGGTDTISSIVAESTTSIWGVGQQNVVHFDGTTWYVHSTFDEIREWSSVDVVNGVGVAVGEPCSVLHFDSGRWTYHQLPWQCVLSDVSVTESGLAWAVGLESNGQTTSSLLLHYNGSEWEKVPHPARRRLTSVYMLSDAEGWVAAGNEGFLRWDGSAWTGHAYPAVVEEPVLAIDGRSRTDVWAVGGADNFMDHSSEPMQIRFHFDGVDWAVDYVGPGYVLRDVSVDHDGSAWAVGEWGAVRHFDGQAWREEDPPTVSSYGFDAVEILEDGQVWCVGNQGNFANFESGAWRRWGGARAASEMWGPTSISLLPDGTGWAVGPSGPVLRRGTVGRTWAEVAGVPDAEDLQVVATTDDGNAWAASVDGGLVAFDRQGWHRYPAPTRLPVRDFSVVNSSSVWFVASSPAGDQGGAASDIGLYEGDRWRIVFSTRDARLRSIDMIAPTRGCAAGEKVVCLIGGRWVTEDGVEDIVDLRLDSTEHGWAIGLDFLLEYSSGSWLRTGLKPVGPRGFDVFQAVDIAPDGDVWILGDRSIYSFDGAVWRNSWLPGGSAFYHSALSIAPVDDSYGIWVGARFDTIARLAGRPQGTVLPHPTEPSGAATETPEPSVSMALVPLAVRH